MTMLSTSKENTIKMRKRKLTNGLYKVLEKMFPEETGTDNLANESNRKKRSNRKNRRRD